MNKSLEHLAEHFSALTRFAVLLLLGYGSALVVLWPAPRLVAGASGGVTAVYFIPYLVLGVTELLMMRRKIEREEQTIRLRLRTLQAQ